MQLPLLVQCLFFCDLHFRSAVICLKSLQVGWTWVTFLFFFFFFFSPILSPHRQACLWPELLLSFSFFSKIYFRIFFFFFSIHCSELQGLIRDWTSAAIFHFRGNIVWDFFFQLLSNLLTDVSEVQWLISNSEDVCASFLVSKIWNCFWCMTALFWSLSSHWMIVGPLCHIFSDYPGYIFWCWFCVNRTSDGLGRFGLCTVKNQLRTFLSFSAPFVGKFHSHECHPRVKRIASDCGALIPAVGNHFIQHIAHLAVSVLVLGDRKNVNVLLQLLLLCCHRDRNRGGKIWY